MAAKGTKKPRVLVVEDNAMNKVLVKEILIMHGYAVIEASTGREAVETALREKPDIVLMDINLPEMDGVAATKLIKGSEALKHVPVVALTASAMQGDRERIMAEGFDGYVPKPIEFKVLLRTLADGLLVHGKGKKE
ncbi:MAG: response regulator [Deltaproteobacteria bacterium]|mgnify:FL=1